MPSRSIGANGDLADYLVVEAANARRIPDNMSLELADNFYHDNVVIPSIYTVEDSQCKISSGRAVGRRMARRPHPCPSRMYFSVGRRRRTDRPCHSASIEGTRRRNHHRSRHEPSKDRLRFQSRCPPLHQFLENRRDPIMCQAHARSWWDPVRIRHRG